MGAVDSGSNKRAIFSDKFSLLLELVPPNFSKSYGYLLTIKNAAQENTIKYEVDIAYVKTIPEKARLFSINKSSKTYLNDTEPDLLVDKMANEAGSVLYPLIIEVDFNGRFLTVHNYKEILERWKTKRVEIKNYYTGDQAEKYCELMDQTITSENLLNWSVQKDFLIATYFTAIYKSYTPSLKIEEEAAYPLVGKSLPVTFSIIQQVQEYLNDLDAIELHHAGVAIDERSINDIEQEQNFALSKSIDPESKPVDGKYTARYMLHAQTKAIRSIDAEWILNKEQIIRVSLHETVVDAEVLLATNNNYPTSIIILDKEHERPNILGNIWKSLFG
ncbi:MAG: hypothetical protein JWR38_4249 [Mucilaginibacter sp.]|nr:hypothetical protein [Mucilaginibacter sp.]